MLAVHFRRETPIPEGTLNEVMSGLFDSHSDVVLYNLTIISPLKITGVLHTTPYMKKKVKTCLSGLSSYRSVHLWRRFWEIIRQMTCIEPHKVAPLTAKPTLLHRLSLLAGQVERFIKRSAKLSRIFL
jgi:hypothetical protein